MITIKYIKNYGGKISGSTEVVTNNTAHGLIEKGIAVKNGLYENKMFEGAEDKMMKSEEKVKKISRKRINKKIYRTKEI